jgi:hypothetical protein
VATTLLALALLSTTVLAEGLPVRRPVDERKAALALPGSIGGIVFQDWDVNGTRSAEEPGLAEAVVVVRDGMGAIVASVVTDFDGLYRIEGLRAGTYSVSVLLPEGYSLVVEGEVLVQVSARQDSEANFATQLLLR